jgi:iron complex transport system permease protein
MIGMFPNGIFGLFFYFLRYMADLVSRVILAPAEMPVGIITALIGGPFFLWTLFRSHRESDIW